MGMTNVEWLRVYGSHQTGHSSMTRGERERLTTIADELEKLQRMEFDHDWELVKQARLELEEFVEKHYETLYERHMDEMPYGVAKARTGDPHQWLIAHYERKL